MSLTSKSNLHEEREYKYKNEKRKKYRIKFPVEILYPRLNNESVHEKYGLDESVLEAVNLSEQGICFKSKIKLKVGDFINFSLKIDKNPSFWCMAVVKWVSIDDNFYVAGCEFISQSLVQIQAIREYVKTKC
ncbi:PilZ domain-containing protein [Clostridium neuense]|uniref:PilZ domain-containing protein n=1 Tax=Clostridium neuense TaxID=1728934 RepID=A0ABW8TI84_9CLOT